MKLSERLTLLRRRINPHQFDGRILACCRPEPITRERDYHMWQIRYLTLCYRRVITWALAGYGTLDDWRFQWRWNTTMAIHLRRAESDALEPLWENEGTAEA